MGAAMTEPMRTSLQAAADSEPKQLDAAKTTTTVAEIASEDRNSQGKDGLVPPPLSMKLMAIVFVSAISFGSQWSGGITGAMKSTIKKEMKINNTEYALLDGSEDFMVTALMLISGFITDRYGGAGIILWGNVIFSAGYLLTAASAQVRSYKFMVFARVITAFGDIATQIAQYKVFSSWFSPNNGFASTLGFELGLGKIGAFVGKSSANIIAKNTGNFANVYWVAAGMNLFTNVIGIAFLMFSRYCERRYSTISDPATGEQLHERNKRFKLKKVLELPWVFWCIMAFSLFETSTAIVFTQNATELAEQTFDVDSITAGWYTAVVQYAGFFIVPCLGVFIDIFGNRITIIAICGTTVFLAMVLVAFGPTMQGTAAAFGIYAFGSTLGPTVIIDGIRTSVWDASIFGTAYAVKITLNNAMNIVVRVITGHLQDIADDSYRLVKRAYVALSALSVLVALGIVTLAVLSLDMRRLQWSRKTRLRKGDVLRELRDRHEMCMRGQDEQIAVTACQNSHGGDDDDDDEATRVAGASSGSRGVAANTLALANVRRWNRDKMLSVGCFGGLMLLVLGSWCAYFWGIATGNND